MNLNNKTNTITESSVIAALIVIFVFLGVYITPAILFLYPVPIVILGVRHNIKASIATMFVSAILITILFDPITAVLINVLFGLLAIALTFMIDKKYNSYNIMVSGTIASFLSIVLTLIGTGYMAGVKVYDMFKENFNFIIDTQRELFKEMNLSSNEVNEMINLMSDAFDYTLLILPAIIIIFSLFNTYINYWISAVLLKRLKCKEIKIPTFSKFKLPNNILLGILVIGIASSIINYYELFYYDTIVMNLLVIGIFVFFLQGLAVIVYLLDKTKTPRFLKGLIIALVVLTGGLMPIIALIGLLDVVFNFRRIKRG